MSESRVLRLPSSIRGYHVYQTEWDSRIGEILECCREINNLKDRYAVSVVKDDNIVGHLPKKLSTLRSLFIRRGGSIILVK